MLLVLFALHSVSSPPLSNSLRFISMCRVGGGFSDQELSDLRSKLAPVLK